MRLFQSISLVTAFLFTTLLLVRFGTVSAEQACSASALAVSVIPRPSQVTPGEGKFLLQPETAVYVSGGAEIEKIGRFLSDRLSPSTGFAITVHATDDTAPPEKSFLLTTKNVDASLDEEGYQLTVAPQQVVLRAAKPAGLFRGVQTIRQLLPAEIESRTKIPGRVWAMPCLEIRDIPRFAWRGSLLDSCRHFMTKKFVKRYIDLLAYHKMNRFHWHLTDDQSWAIEIKKYPKLTEIGAYRSSGPNRFGGYFTQDDIREIVAYAAERYIMVVPEIEMPGHSQAALACYPELSCTGGPFAVGTVTGVYKDVYCAGNEKTFEFLQDVLTEVMSLFPSPYIHIGGDECPKDRWKACPRCQARIQVEKLKDEHELQSYFIKRIEKFINEKGKTLIGWDEILEGGLAPQAMVQSWRGTEGGIAAAAAGHDVVMSPYSHCYIDYPNRNTTLEKIYSFEPVPAQLTAEQARHILGAEANLWSDRCAQEMADAFAYPRICGLADVLWSPADQRNWNDFSTRMTTHYQRLDQLGVRYYKPVPLVEAAEWNPGKLSEKSGAMRFDIASKMEKLGSCESFYVIGWFFEGDNAITIGPVVLIADGTIVGKNDHVATVGWSNPLTNYKLVMPKDNSRKLELEITLHGEGGSNSRGKFWLSTIPNPPDIF
jgi:hexosaminidase